MIAHIPPPTLDQRRNAVIENIGRLSKHGAIGIAAVANDQNLNIRELIAWGAHFYGEATLIR